MFYYADSDCSTITSFDIEDDLFFPPVTLSFHNSLSFEILKLYKVILNKGTIEIKSANNT